MILSVWIHCEVKQFVRTSRLNVKQSPMHAVSRCRILAHKMLNNVWMSTNQDPECLPPFFCLFFFPFFFLVLFWLKPRIQKNVRLVSCLMDHRVHQLVADLEGHTPTFSPWKQSPTVDRTEMNRVKESTQSQKLTPGMQKKKETSHVKS